MIYPIGEQDFAGIRERGLVYVDKTDLVYKMTHESKYYFLSRPRRFGKSLLLSTLEYYFRGRKELFAGLAIDRLETEWKQHPVLHLNFSRGRFDTLEDLTELLDAQLEYGEREYRCTGNDKSLAWRFTNLILSAYEQTGRQVVILIDEYDAPLQAALDKPVLLEQYQSTLRDIYLCLKKNDKYIRFAFLTGITAWGKMGVFSALNNLKDITIDKNYATLCGITEEELHAVFHDEVAAMAEDNGLTTEQAYQRLKAQYDGYHFALPSPGVYNPFSLLWALDSKQFGNYWIRTGETQVVATLAQQAHIDIDALLVGNISMPEDNLLNTKNPFENPITFLYQAGYLTIKGYDDDTNEYLLQIPNGEVRRSLAKHLLAPAFGLPQEESAPLVKKIQIAMGKREIDDLVTVLNDHILRKEHFKFKEKRYESFFHHILYVVFLSAGFEVTAEAAGHSGRADLVVKTSKYVYVIELKLNGSAQEALAQIHDKGYADPYLDGSRPIIKLGLNFNETTRLIDDYAAEM